ncbi:COP9 signalosome [Cantharellus anzutake]|uniref:COP9 signalosome n=1 Tax=Cantharellus anzutake TaxID=1750568 RepID=UPI001904457A|nr:COP9 signalosome [Cantharellus anzutake]KAF8330077.1 COP9 signalosome [Cantharellus anzutake]
MSQNQQTASPSASAAPTPPPASPPAPVAPETDHPPAPAGPSLQAGTVNPFRLVFPDLVLHSRQSRWDDLIRTAERADLKKAGRESDVTRFLVVIPLSLSYLILDQAPSAHWVLMRLPDELINTPLPQLLFKLTASIADRKYTNIYSRANDVLSLVSETTLDPELKEVVTELLQKFLEVFRRRTFDLLRQAFTEISVSEVQQYLGVSPDVILQVAKASGQWTYNSTSQLLRPICETSHPLASTSDASTLRTFKSVWSGAIGLEGTY